MAMMEVWWVSEVCLLGRTFAHRVLPLDGLQLLAQWEEDFNFPSGSKLGLLGAIQNIGSLASYPFTPYFADGLGRKRTIFFGAVVMIAGAIIQTASQSVNMFIGARFMRKLFETIRSDYDIANFYLRQLGSVSVSAPTPHQCWWWKLHIRKRITFWSK